MHIVYKFILSHASGDTWGYTPRRNMFVAMTGGQSMGSSQSYCLKQYMRGLFLISTGEKDDLDGHNQNFDVKKEEKNKEKNEKKGSKTPQHTTHRRTG
jgi:hypothetical protein